MSDADPITHLDLMILARIAGRSGKAPPKRSDVIASLERYVARDRSPQARKDEIGRHIDCLIGRQFLEPSREVTAAGQARLCRDLGLAEPPAWADARDRVFPMLSLGLDPASDEDTQAFKRTGYVVAAVIDQAYGLRLKALTPNRACLALAARRLDGRPARNASDLGKASVEHWVAGRDLGTGSPGPGSEPPATTADGNGTVAVPPAPTDAQFADAVLRTVAIREVRRFGAQSVYISSIFQRLQQDDTRFAAMSWYEFADRLVEVNRQHRVTLSRADHVAAMDPDELRRSHIHDLGSDFHFVVDERVR